MNKAFIDSPGVATDKIHGRNPFLKKIELSSQNGKKERHLDEQQGKDKLMKGLGRLDLLLSSEHNEKYSGLQIRMSKTFSNSKGK